MLRGYIYTQNAIHVYLLCEVFYQKNWQLELTDSLQRTTELARRRFCKETRSMEGTNTDRRMRSSS
jgi:hypothetical protein